MSQATPQKLGVFMKQLAEWAVAITLISTFASLVINFFLFETWGVSFASVVTPSDIVVGGVEGLRIFIPLSLAVYFSIGLERIFYGIKLSHELAMSISLLCVVLVGLHIGAVTSGSFIASKIVIWSSLTAIVTILAASYMYRWRLNSSSDHKHPKLLLLVGLMGFTISVFYVINEATFRDLNLEIVDSKNCKSPERVVWSGLRWYFRPARQRLTTRSRSFSWRSATASPSRQGQRRNNAQTH